MLYSYVYVQNMCVHANSFICSVSTTSAGCASRPGRSTTARPEATSAATATRPPKSSRARTPSNALRLVPDSQLYTLNLSRHFGPDPDACNHVCTHTFTVQCAFRRLRKRTENCSSLIASCTIIRASKTMTIASRCLSFRHVCTRPLYILTFTSHVRNAFYIINSVSCIVCLFVCFFPYSLRFHFSRQRSKRC